MGGQSTGWYIHIAKYANSSCHGPWTLEEMEGGVVLRIVYRAEGTDAIIYFVDECPRIPVVAGSETHKIQFPFVCDLFLPLSRDLLICGGYVLVIEAAWGINDVPVYHRNDTSGGGWALWALGGCLLGMRPHCLDSEVAG